MSQDVPTTPQPADDNPFQPHRAPGANPDEWLNCAAVYVRMSTEHQQYSTSNQMDLVSRSIDNRIGYFVVLEALRRLAKDAPAASGLAVGTTQEEIAYSGGGARTSAFGLEPDAAVVVDVTHATDYPGVEKKEVGDFKLGSGPALSRGSAVSPVVFDQLVAAAEAGKIPFTIEAAPRGTSTDADAIHTSRRGIATGLVSVPCRYMHSPNEMVALDDLDRTAALLAAWVRRLKSDTSFIPF